MLYFAYGSNLNLSQMSNRCPNATKLGAIYLQGWRLVFRGVADIERSNDNNDMLPVGMWDITDDCEKSLDLYGGYPRLYKKIWVSGMLTYVMNNNKDYIPPSQGYFKSIVDGYRDFGLKNQHLYEALGWSHYISDQHHWSQPKKKRTYDELLTFTSRSK